MNEAGIVELLGTMRDAARARAMFRLAEHLDDAILLAASEFHDKLATLSGVGEAFNVRPPAEDLRDAARSALH